MAELASQPTSIQSIYAWYKDGKLNVNRRYQRKLVWTLEEKQRLIESILKKYPIPAILLAEREKTPGTYEIIDGLQRLHAIVSFIEMSFPSIDGAYFDIVHFPTAKARADHGAFPPKVGEPVLTQGEVSTILDYTLAISVMRNATESEINDVFGRINTYGHRLSDQERRQAGVQNDFSNMVRNIACTARGDVSSDVLPLELMPSISIDLPMTKHGYEVKAEEVFWVQQGILRSTDLRDSMDEQCIADIAACVLGGQLIERSKDALDEIYSVGSAESQRVLDGLEVYGDDKFSYEFKFCVDEIMKVCAEGKAEKLRSIIFKNETTNAFPAIFATILIAFHELIVKEGKKISDYAGVRKAIINLTERIETSRKATSPDERRKNIDTIKGLIGDSLVKEDIKSQIYGSHATVDIEATIRRSEIELANYELKQGLLTLDDKRTVDTNLIDKVVKTICAIANNGPKNVGKLIIGVTDKDSDATRIQDLDEIVAKKVGKRFVVGVNREAKVLGLSTEQYFSQWKDAIRNSALSQKLKDSVLSNIDFNAFFGLGVLVITVPAQSEPSYVADRIYFREADSTVEAVNAPQIAGIAQRFTGA
jgi:hypothetical protein